MADKDLLERMDKSIARLRAKGYDAEEMIAKRNAVWDGAEYKSMDVAKYIIANVASYITETNIGLYTNKPIKKKRKFNLQQQIMKFERDIESQPPFVPAPIEEPPCWKGIHDWNDWRCIRCNKPKPITSEPTKKPQRRGVETIKL